MDDDFIAEWESGLPSPEELTPLSQSLIPPELASAFSIPSSEPPDSQSASFAFASQRSLARVSPSTFAKAAEDDHGGITDAAAAAAVVLSHSRAGDGTGAGIVGGMPAAAAPEQNAFFPPQESSSRLEDSPAGAFSSPSTIHPGSSPGSYGVQEGKHFLSAISNGVASPFMASSFDRSNNPGAVKAAAATGGDSSSNSRDASARRLVNEESEMAPAMVESSMEEQTARTLKRPRLVWTPQLHKRFVDAVVHLGIKNAVPKTIMQLMNVEGLTRENVASHLQKYRLYLKRMQGLSSEGPFSSDHLFASTPVPPSLAASAHFLASHRDDGIPFPPPLQHPLPLPAFAPPPSMNPAGPFASPFDPQAFSRTPPPQRFDPSADTKERVGDTTTHHHLRHPPHHHHHHHHQQPSSPSRPILTLFPTSSR